MSRLHASTSGPCASTPAQGHHPRSLPPLCKRPPCHPTQGLLDYYDPDGNYVQVRFTSLAGAPAGQHYVITGLRMQLRGVTTPDQMQGLQAHLIQRWGLLDGNPGKHGPAKPDARGYPDIMLTQTDPAFVVRAGSAKIIETDGYLWTKDMYRQFEGGSAIWVKLPYGTRAPWAQAASEQAHTLQPSCAKP